MGKTQELKKTIKTLLDEVEGETYQKHAPDDAGFPYKVFQIESIDLGDIYRDDFVLEINVWDKNESTEMVDNITDEIEEMLNALNHPTPENLPTFYRISRKEIDDPDKSLKRNLIKFQVQNYEREWL